MASSRLKTTKDGRRFYEIRCRVRREAPELTKRWYVPSGWSQKAIERELAKVSAEFERQCKNGEFVSHKAKIAAEKKAAEERAAEEARIMTVRQYGGQVFMPAKLAGLIGRRAISEKTRVYYSDALRLHIYPTLGERRITEVTRADVDALLLAKANTNLSQSTLNSIYITLRQLFAAADEYSDMLLGVNPMAKVKKPKRSKTSQADKEKSIPTFSIGELQHIMECLDTEDLKWQAYVLLLIDTGCRRGEACGLRWRSVDFKNGTVTFDNNICYTSKKRGGRGVYADSPKTSTSIRTVDVCAEVVTLLKRLQLEQAASVISPYVFARKDSTLPMNPDSATRFFHRFEKRHGIQDFHPHKLRHSFASVAITNGADVASVSEKLGHADKGTTLRMYTHANPESIRKAGDIFRDALRRTEQAKEA